MSDNCKQSITVPHCTINVLLIWPTNGKIVLKRQTVHADAVAGLPLPGLHRTAEPVWSTHHIHSSFYDVRVRVSLEMMALSPSPCS